MSGNGVTRYIVAIVAMLLLAVLVRPGIAAEPSREYQVKAAFIFNFIQFTEWPDDAFAGSDDPLVVAILGTNDFGSALDQALTGKTVNGRPITVRYFARLDELGRCHVLFVGRSETGRLNDLFSRIGSSSILSIGEAEEFPWAGGVIRFITEENKVRFELNLEAAAQARLRISSKLIKLARIFRK